MSIENKKLKEITRNTYDTIFENWDEKRRYSWTPVINFINKISNKDEIKFLDLGCGGGRHLELAVNSGIKKENIIGCDYSTSQLKTVKQKGFKTINCDLINLKFEDNFFDYIICIAVHHHLLTVEEQFLALLEMKRVLKKGGKILLSNWFAEEDFIDEQIKKGKFTFLNLNKEVNNKKKGVVKVNYTYNDKKYDRYYYLFEEEELILLCEKAEFKILNKLYEKGNLYLELEK